MDQKIWGPFSGTQLTILLTAAILGIAPTTLRAVDAFTNVAIEDPVSGRKAAIDPARRLVVYDAVGGTDETPANFVRILSFPGSNCSSFYTVPAGKALIIRSLSAYMHKSANATESQEVILYDAANCGGTLFASAITVANHDTKVIDFGNGVAVPAGRSLSSSGFNFSGSFQLYGYLVPAGWVPASAPAVASPARSPGMSPTMFSTHK
jgi:hypothetical protein